MTAQQVKETVKVFIIQHKETKKQWQSYSGKSSWRAVGHAKNAWANGMDSQYPPTGIEKIKVTNYYGRVAERFALFDEQDVYEIVELKTETLSQLEEAINLLNLCLGRVDHSLDEQIRTFLSDRKGIK